MFGVAESTGQTKSREIRRLLDMGPLSPEWTLPSRLADNPMVWMLEVDGLMIDIRHAPVELQRLAFEQGLIPSCPANSRTGPRETGTSMADGVTSGSITRDRREGALRISQAGSGRGWNRILSCRLITCAFERDRKSLLSATSGYLLTPTAVSSAARGDLSDQYRHRPSPHTLTIAARVDQPAAGRLLDP